MSSQLYWEKEQGNLALYIMAPNSMMAILLGMALGGLLATTLRAVAIMVLGSWMFKVTYQVASFSQLFFVFILAMVALYGLGMMSASIFLLLSREAWHLSNLAQEPVYLVSGFYFPIKSLRFLDGALRFDHPAHLGLDAMRQLAFPSGAFVGFPAVCRLRLRSCWCCQLLFFTCARWLLAYMERLAIREGRLTESRR